MNKFTKPKKRHKFTYFRSLLKSTNTDQSPTAVRRKLRHHNTLPIAVQIQHSTSNHTKLVTSDQTT
ncbi:hypothetical protein HanIR_Chr05g0252291 [Helianthus annuus]|nr:hypothetical protein HanIR_Chr05g0252291 [Helianthus annuus]